MSSTLRIGTPIVEAPAAGAVDVPPTTARTDLAPLCVDAAGVARLLAVSERHVWALHSAGRLPSPVRLGRARRWIVSELREWLASGAPSRDG